MINFSEDTALTQEFVSESMDMLDMVEPQLLEMSKNIDTETFDDEVVNSIFRLFHTLKGSAGFMNLTVVQSVSHEAENLLDLVRTGHKLSERHMDLLIRTTDFIRNLMEKIEVENSDAMAKEEGESLVTELVGAAHDVNRGGAADPNAGEAPTTQTSLDDDGSNDSQPIEGSLDFTAQFATEALELLEQSEKKIFELRDDPGSKEFLQELLRLIHTFKGNCGFMDFGDMEKLSHGMESVLEQFQLGTVAVTEKYLDLLLSIQGLLHDAVAKIRNGGSSEIGNANIYLDMIADTLECSGVKREKQAEESPPNRTPAEDTAPPKVVPPAMANGGAKIHQPTEAAKPIPPQEDQVDPSTYEQPGKGRRKTDHVDYATGKHPSRQDIRVNVEKLDTLFDLVGELIIAESMVTHNPEIEGYEIPSFEKAASHLSKITRELHDISMLVRMIPVSGTFQKMNRLVHDLSRKSGKEVDLELIGEDTEVDKSIVELISDPLVHLIRNSVDHGLEPADVRLAAGKSAKGKITIEARHEGNEVWIIVGDDGRGLDRDTLLQKGIERGLVNGDGAGMSDGDVFNLIFEPGFSTAKEITNISGRGVGMDVVKRNIEQIKGRVEIHSESGKGTKFVIRIPLTLAIIEGMMVRVGESQYTVPILAMKEAIRTLPEQVITTAEGQEFVKIRASIFPVLRLHELHHLKANHSSLENGVLLVLDHQGLIFCLFVDELVGLHQTVVKALTGYLSDVRGISGYTILGNGDVSLILDLGSLLAIAGTPANLAANELGTL